MSDPIPGSPEIQELQREIEALIKKAEKRAKHGKWSKVEKAIQKIDQKIQGNKLKEDQVLSPEQLRRLEKLKKLEAFNQQVVAVLVEFQKILLGIDEVGGKEDLSNYEKRIQDLKKSLLQLKVKLRLRKKQSGWSEVSGLIKEVEEQLKEGIVALEEMLEQKRSELESQEQTGQEENQELIGRYREWLNKLIESAQIELQDIENKLSDLRSNPTDSLKKDIKGGLDLIGTLIRAFESQINKKINKLAEFAQSAFDSDDFDLEKIKSLRNTLEELNNLKQDPDFIELKTRLHNAEFEFWQITLEQDSSLVQEVVLKLKEALRFSGSNAEERFAGGKRKVLALKATLEKLENEINKLRSNGETAKADYLEADYAKKLKKRAKNWERRLFGFWQGEFGELYKQWLDPADANSLVNLTKADIASVNSQKKLKELKEKLTSDLDDFKSRVNNDIQVDELTLFQRLATEFLSELSLENDVKGLIGLIDERLESLENVAATARAAVDFFRSRYPEDEWRDKTPRELAENLFDKVKEIIEENFTGGVFMDMKLLEHKIQLGDYQITLENLIGSFKELGIVLNPRDADLAKEFSSLADSLLVAAVVVGKTFNLGKKIFDAEGNLDKTLELLSDPSRETYLPGRYLRGLFEIGEDFLDPAERSWGESLYWTMQVYLAMNWPIEHGLAVMDTGDESEPKIFINAVEKNPLAEMPFAINDESAVKDRGAKWQFLSWIASRPPTWQPPWLTDPDWPRKGTAESLSMLSERRQKIIREHVMELLYGTSSPRRDESRRGLMAGEPGSLYEKFWHNQADREEELGGVRGRCIAYLARNLGEYFLVPAASEGGSMKKDSAGNYEVVRIGRRDYKVVIWGKGPVGENRMSSVIHPGLYAAKKRKRRRGEEEDGGVSVEASSEGSSMSASLIGLVNAFAEPIVGVYYFVPRKELEGVRLVDAFLIYNNNKDFVNNVPLEEMMPVDDNRKLQGFFSRAKQLIEFAMSEDGVIPWEDIERNPGAFLQALGRLSNLVHYLISADWGEQIASWEKYEDYEKYIKFEKERFFPEVRRRMEKNIPLSDPPPKDFTPEERRMWHECLSRISVKPTKYHFFLNGRRTDASGVGYNPGPMFRYALDWRLILAAVRPELIKIEPLRKLLEINKNDMVTAIKKVLFAIFFADDAKKQNANAKLNSKSLLFIREALSYQVWADLRGESKGVGASLIKALRGISNFVRGIREEYEEYGGIGYWTDEEIDLLFELAGIEENPLSRIMRGVT